MDSAILVINAGSSSIKFALWHARSNSNESSLAARGSVTGIGRHGRFSVQDAAGQSVLQRELAAERHEDALTTIFDWIEPFTSEHPLTAVGHRVVHGGMRYAAPVLCTEEVLAEVAALSSLAPLHQPFSLAGIRMSMGRYPDLPNVLCFDTAFHRTQPAVAQRIALPRALQREGIMNYGFHGLSYEYIASVLPAFSPQAAAGRVVVAHLGHGASMCAMREGKSMATTMTFSPLDGLPMGRRCGALDPGVVLYLLREKGMTVDQVAHLLNAESGLLGLSGISDDMRELLSSDDPHAREAVDLFVYRAVREVGSLAAALGGLDALVFTAGMGEHAVEIRERICQGVQWLGLVVDKSANARGEHCISRPDSPVSAWMIPTNEELIIVRHTAALSGAA